MVVVEVVVAAEGRGWLLAGCWQGGGRGREEVDRARRRTGQGAEGCSET